jgi:ATP-dependent RNA helicase RhlE
VTNFSDLGLAPELLSALEGEGYVTPTPIQAQAIPVVLEGRDLLGIAQTGTGKTAAFALPILNRLAAERRPRPRRGARVLVLSPTRELATQIADSFRTYGRHLNLRIAVVFGGVGHRPQIMALREGVDVLVATPGRLLDHIGERDVELSQTEVLVLDEADQMLDLGFIKPIRQIVAKLPKQRQSLFFSATMPDEIAGLAADLLDEPKRVAVTPVASTVERIRQRVIHVERVKKRALLAELLADPDMARTLVFTRTKRGADRVALYLVGAAGIQAAAIHGNKSQSQREQALRQFRDGHVRVLVATDIAARGIDIDAVSHVVNYELPEVPEAYVHRIGRTARAGASGSAISLCDGEERHLLRAIERLTRQTIPTEDRRNDAGLAADRTRAGREGVSAPREGRESARHGRRDGDRGGRADRKPEAAGRERDTRHGQRDAQHRSRQAPRGDRQAPHSDRQAPHSDRHDAQRRDRGERGAWRSDGPRPARSGASAHGARPDREGGRTSPRADQGQRHERRHRDSGHDGGHRTHADGATHGATHGSAHRPERHRDGGRADRRGGGHGEAAAPRPAKSGHQRPRSAADHGRGHAAPGGERHEHKRPQPGDRPKSGRPRHKWRQGGSRRPEAV